MLVPLILPPCQSVFKCWTSEKHLKYGILFVCTILQRYTGQVDFVLWFNH